MALCALSTGRHPEVRQAALESLSHRCERVIRTAWTALLWIRELAAEKPLKCVALEHEE